jgi:hypothetical protein
MANLIEIFGGLLWLVMVPRIGGGTVVSPTLKKMAA